MPTPPKPDREATAAATPSPHPPTTQGPAPTPRLVVNWSTVSNSGLETMYRATDLAMRNGRYVVVGEDMQYAPTGEQTASDRATVWVSDDGLHWRESALPADIPEALWLRGVAAGPAGYVAVGSGWAGVAGEFPAFAYFSADGLTWERVGAGVFGGGDQGLIAVGPAGGGMVAFAQDGGVFTSIDGQAWTQSVDADASSVARGLRALAVDGETLWAVSGIDDSDTDTPPLEIWRTDDGHSWQRVVQLDGSRGAYTAAMAAGPLGLVVITGVGTWHSADGTAWQQAGRAPLGASDVVADSSGFVAVRDEYTGGCCVAFEEDNIGQTWTSADGDVWRKMPDKGWRAQSIQAVLIDSGTLIGLGADYREWPFEGAVWTSAPAD